MKVHESRDGVHNPVVTLTGALEALGDDRLFESTLLNQNRSIRSPGEGPIGFPQVLGMSRLVIKKKKATLGMDLYRQMG